MIHARQLPLEPEQIAHAVEVALREDLGSGDMTTEGIIDPTMEAAAELLAREEVVLAGLEVFAAVFRYLDQAVLISCRHHDGDRVPAGTVVLSLEAKAEAILKGERTALNFLQHLSGVATRTARFTAVLEGSTAVLLDTRKTTPGLRALEKYAVRVGGGANHRFGLFDGIMIKDNHRMLIADLKLAVTRLKELFPLRRVEVECSSLEEVREALAAGADILLLDNMTSTELAVAVREVNGRCPIEVSGNISLDNLRAMAVEGVDYISSGSIIHGATFVDFSLEMLPRR